MCSSYLVVRRGTEARRPPRASRRARSPRSTGTSAVRALAPAGTTQVIYEYRVCVGYTDSNVISNFKILVDSDEVTSGRHIVADYTHPQSYRSIKWGFNIGGSADTAVGRLASWTSDKTIKVQWREYSSSNEARLHNVQHWDGAGANLVVKPQLSITAIG